VVLLNTGSSAAPESELSWTAAGRAGAIVAETETLVYTCRLTGPGEWAFTLQATGCRGALPSGQSAGSDCAASYPSASRRQVLWTTLGNVNPSFTCRRRC